MRLDGTVGICDVSGDWYCCLIGINHNPGIEGERSLHFQFPYTVDGKGLVLTDKKYNSYCTSGFIMNPINDTKYATTSDQYKYGFNEGGWKECYARQILIPQFYNAIILVWQVVITSILKCRDNVGNKQNNAASVTATSDIVWYIAEFEVFGKRGYANSTEQDYQKHYDYYRSGGSRIRYKYDLLEEEAVYRLASPLYYAVSDFVGIDNLGNWIGIYAGFNRGVSPCFAVA